jgi:hypothetical protein
MELNGKEVDWHSLAVDDVYSWDYPDFSDAHFCEAQFVDGTPLTDEELMQLTDKYADVMWEMAYDALH